MTSNITIPTMGGMQRRTRTGPFFFMRVAIHAPPMVAMIWTAPNGIFSRMVLYLSNPKELMIKGPKVVTPPLGMLDWLVSVRPGRADCLRDGEDQREPTPRLDVEHAFSYVFPFPGRGDNTHLVCSQPFDCKYLVVLVEELGIDGRIWKKDTKMVSNEYKL